MSSQNVAESGVDVLALDRRRPFSVVGRLPGGRFVNGVVGVLIDRALGLGVLQSMYDATPTSVRANFPEAALAALDIVVDVCRSSGGIPHVGPLLVVANHPFGCLDGLAVLNVLRQVRADVKVLGNQWLATIPELAGTLITVDPFERAGARRANAVGLRAALAWLSSGGCLLAFPAGEVADKRAGEGVAVDRAWRPHIGALAVRSGAACLPVFVAGANSWRFRAAGRVHPLLRTAMLARELVARTGSRVQIVIGDPIAARELAPLPPDDRSAYLKSRTYLLAAPVCRAIQGRNPAPPGPRARRDEPHAIRKGSRASTGTNPDQQPIAEPVDPVVLRDEIQALPADSLLAASGGLQVFCARAAMLPTALCEIGRLREQNFREAGEGTGKARDLDRFDDEYWQLFAWDAARSCIAGAYRIGVTSEIVPRHGASGLYTRTLFHYDERLLAEIGPAIELGRSFVCCEYRRAFSPLLTLWQGIGAFIVRRPECRHVFGAVSISSRYDTRSRQLLVRFLTTAALHPAAARLVRPRRPLPAPPSQDHLLETATLSSLESVSSLLRAIDPDGKSIPVLLRQYLNLNARLLGFSVDPDFGDALDGLMLADLTEVRPSMLQRLMGREGAARFLAYHRGQNATAAASWQCEALRHA